MSLNRVCGVLLFVASVVGRCADSSGPGGEEAPWDAAARHGAQARKALLASRRYVEGWLAHADPVTGLLPRNLTDSPYWNARDAAADNYPFMVLATFFTDRPLFQGRMQEILATEQRVCNRLGPLPDDWDFRKQSFRTSPLSVPSLIFGASEYAKDGLLPLTEWLGPSPWADRMLGLIDGIWRHASNTTEVGLLPAADHEVAGNLLQVHSRLYWFTGQEVHREKAMQLGDYFLIHHPPHLAERLQLDDHGCEVVNGLSEAYYLAAHRDPERRTRWRPAMHSLLDRILEVARDTNGLLHSVVNPRTGAKLSKDRTDNWGYNYNAFLVVADLDDVPRYREAVEFVLRHLLDVRDYPWEGGGADGYADSLEGGLNLLNRLPIPEAAEWADHVAGLLLAKQRDTGVIEGWHGDGNFTRTALMYALWKSQGMWAEPWRGDLRLGAARSSNGWLHVELQADWPWTGRLRFDRPRHREHWHMPSDYARLNQFPEWFTVPETGIYDLPAGQVTAAGLRKGLAAAAAPGKPFRLALKVQPPVPNSFDLPFAAGQGAEAKVWQQAVRTRLLDTVQRQNPRQNHALDLRREAPESTEGYSRVHVRLVGNEGQPIDALLTVPEGKGPFPAVVCLHGHGGRWESVHDTNTVYHGFARRLASRGFVTLAPSLSHMDYAPSQLWNLIRFVDALTSMPEVDPSRIGVAGLSMGGEWTMWLAACEPRVKAAVVSGWMCTTEGVLRVPNCPCWRPPGLIEICDIAEVHGLIAPRPLLFESAEADGCFPIDATREGFRRVQRVYAALGAEGAVHQHVFPGGHEWNGGRAFDFLQQALKPAPAPR